MVIVWVMGAVPESGFGRELSQRYPFSARIRFMVLQLLDVKQIAG